MSGYIFVFAPKNSGTTVLSQYITAQCDGYLPPFGNFEGQAAPSVKPIMRATPWDESNKFDWHFIKGEWDKLLAASGKATFVEASPPNVIQIDEIHQEFGPGIRAVFLISSPYLQIASSLYNYILAPLDAEKIRSATCDWVMMASKVAAAAEAYPKYPLIHYESFVEDPTRINDMLGLPLVAIDAIEGKATTGMREIKDMTSGTISFLKAEELDLISEELSQHQALLDRFGYTLSPGDALLEKAAQEAELFEVGLARRATWIEHGGKPQRVKRLKKLAALQEAQSAGTTAHEEREIAMSDEPSAPKPKGGSFLQRAIAPLLFGIAGIAVLLWLGFWQMDRLAWKEGVLADIEARIAASPVALPAAPDPTEDRYLPVSLTGQFGAGVLRVLVSQKQVGAGYRIISPFESDGRTILVDRGFVRVAQDIPAAPAGQVTVTGNVHWPDDRNSSTPPNDVEGNTWFARDIGPMSDVLGTEPILVITRKLSESDTPLTPLPVDTSGIPNDHLEYAVTWFGLAAIWASMTLYLLWRLRRPSKGKET